MVSLTALTVCLAAVLAAPAQSPDTVLLSFSADWCSQCKTMDPALRRLESGGYPLRRVNVDQEPALARQLQVTSVPCFVLVANGRPVERLNGAASFDRLVQMFAALPTASVANASAPPPPTSPLKPHTVPANVANSEGGPIVRGQSPESRGSFPGFGRLNSLFEKKGTTPANGSAPPTDVFAPRPDTNSLATNVSPPLPAANTTANPVAPAAAIPAGWNQLGGAMPRQEQNGNQASSRAAFMATVRLRVEDPNGHSLGTGTIVDTHDGEALIVTCGHIFRDSKGQGKVHVDIFGPEAPRTVVGKVIDYDLKRDIGVVAVRPNGVVATAKIAPDGFSAAKGDTVFSIGCDRGAEPSIQHSRVTAVNKYLGPANIEVAGQPVDGRSGGGLFSADGKLIGVCNAADPADKEGIYASLETIHWQLSQIGQQHLFQRDNVLLVDNSAPPLPPSRASSPALPMSPVSQPPASAPPVPAAAALVAATANTPSTPPQNFVPSPAAAPLANVQPVANLANTHSGPAPTLPADTEVICIIRSKNDPSGKSRVFFMDRIPAELIERMSADARQEAHQANTRDLSSARSLPPRSFDPPPMLGPPATSRDGVVRGQSN